MQTPSIWIVAIGSAATALFVTLLRYLSKRPLKVASTSEELLDLFQDRCALLEEQVPSTSPNVKGDASEDFRASAAGNPTPPSASPARPATSAEPSPVCRIEAARGRSILGDAGGAMGILRAWRPYVSRRAGLAQDRLARVRASHLPHRSQLGEYEKARVERYLNEIRVGRMTYEEAQHAIASEWIAAYGPTVPNRGIHLR